jgi:biopolymer transport protein ExbD
MPIHAPGKRDRRHRTKPKSGGIGASLSLTPMVDMFTILVIFLLQNYSSTGEVLYIPKEVQLPKASQIKELKPAHVVIITAVDVILDKETIVKADQIKEQKDWMIPALRDRLVQLLREDDIKARQAVAQTISKNLPGVIRPNSTPLPDESRRKITVQADKNIDFLTVKKVMFTVTESGASEINFAVLKKEGTVVAPVTAPAGG